MEEVKRLVLIDGHAMLYRAYFAFPKTLTTREGNLINAVYGFTRILLTVIKEMKPDCLVVSFDVGKTFRHQQFEGYKAHREKMPDELKSQEPITYRVVEALNIPVLTMEGFEADDVIGTMARQASEIKQLTTVIVTGDKDTLQLVTDEGGVKVYMPGRGMKGPTWYNEAEVAKDLGIRPDQITDYKGLAGDNSDNIPGVHGIGKVTAVKLLQQYGTIEGLYEHISDLSGSVRTKLEEGKESAFESKKLATIVRDVPIELDLEAAEVRRYDKDKVVEVFKELGFESLLNKLPNDSFETAVQEALF